MNSGGHRPDPEDGIDIPFRELQPETLQRLIEEFVTRDGSDWDETGCTLEDKVHQVMQQLETGRVKIVFDLNMQTANLVPCP